MKVLFNVHSLKSPRTGIGLYTEHLIDAMAAAGEVAELAGCKGRQVLRGDMLRSLVHSDQTAGDEPPNIFAKKAASFSGVIRGMPGAYPARHFMRDWLARRSLRSLAHEGFIYHEPNYMPLHYPGPVVITVHDLSHVRYPQFHPAERVAFLNRHLPGALERADRVITDSRFVAGEIVDVYGVSSRKIAVTHLAAEGDFRTREPAEVAPTLLRFGLRHRGFVLSVATLEPRKNLERLIAAYAALPDAVRRDNPLVLVGVRGWRNATLVARLQELLVRGEALCLGYLPRRWVADLYSSAAVVAYPSLYEGFGLPLLEAFASGTPIVTSNVTSLPEVSGGAALEVDPLDVDAIRDGLRVLLEDADLRSHHAELGLQRAAEFSWDRCSRQTLDVYRALA
ncbi:glycosyltransferase family 4 protein [Salinisphaera sp. RV14]|uniref:glycosyltransferase family 4 protein n=1 Tax=Salinisphaera sp. RV14 TaxID=3454140 RepID=UPI003F85867C